MAGKRRLVVSKGAKRAFKRARRTLRVRKMVVARPRITKPRGTVQFGLGLPAKAVVTHRYCDTYTITAPLGVFTKNVWNANGMFDPNTTGGGHQPLYFDQFTALYNHYVVIGSKITVKFVPVTLTGAPVMVGILGNDDTAIAATNMSSVMEQTNGRAVKLLSPGQSQSVTLTKRYSAKKIYGGSILAQDKLHGTVNTNPQEAWYYDIVIEGTTAANVSVQATVLVEYIAVWTELKDVAQS